MTPDSRDRKQGLGDTAVRVCRPCFLPGCGLTPQGLSARLSTGSTWGPLLENVEKHPAARNETVLPPLVPAVTLGRAAITGQRNNHHEMIAMDMT